MGKREKRVIRMCHECGRVSRGNRQWWGWVVNWGKWCVFEDKWMNSASKRQVWDKGRQWGQGLERLEMEKCQHGGNSVTAFCFLKSVHRRESSRNQPGPMSVVLWACGREKDGLVHFYCLANAPKSPVSSIIHNVPLLPSKLPPRPFFSPSRSFLSLPPLPPLCVFHCGSSEPWSTTQYIKDDLPIGSHPKFPLWNQVCSIRSPLLCLHLKDWRVFCMKLNRPPGLKILITIKQQTCWLCAISFPSDNS